jgi:3-oxoacyl-[acyl-carrier protein] reductase
MDANTIIAAKAGVMDFTKALCNVMALSGIRVNCIVPGVIETDMNEELSDYDRQLIGEQTSLGTIGLPDHIAQAALFLAQNQFIAGEILNVNGLDDYTAGELDEGIGDVGWLPLGNPEPLT